MNSLKLEQFATQQPAQDEAEIARWIVDANFSYNASNQLDATPSKRAEHLRHAERMANKVLQHDPEHAEALNLMGRIHLDKGEIKQAALYFEGAIDLSPNKPGFFINMGYAKLQAGDYVEAEAAFLRALDLKPSAAYAFAGIAMTRLRQGQYLSAFKHYERLIHKGMFNQMIKEGLFEAASHLQADVYNEALENSLLAYYEFTDIDHTKLGPLTASLLEAKYKLNQPNEELRVDDLARDPLLLKALYRSILPSTKLELILTELRKSLLLNVASTGELVEDYQQLVLAIGIYAARMDYPFKVEIEEERIVIDIHNQLYQMMAKKWSIEQVAGSVMIAAMYEPLYKQNYSHLILMKDLKDWPEALRPLLAECLYDAMEEQAIVFGIPSNESASDSHLTLLEKVDRPFPRWTHLALGSTTDYYQALVNELGADKVPTSFAGRTLKILISGCGTGLRALRMAKYCPNIEVTAIDGNKKNLAYAVKKAKELDINNIQFYCVGMGEVGNLDAKFDIVELTGKALAEDDLQQTIKHHLMQLAPEGLLRLSLPNEAAHGEVAQLMQVVQQNRMIPSAGNIRRFRRAVMEEAAAGHWQTLLGDRQFYSNTGIKATLFEAKRAGIDEGSLNGILNGLKLNLLGKVGQRATPTGEPVDTLDIYVAR